MSFCLTAKNLSLTGLSLIDLILRLDESDESERIRGAEDSSDNNETLRQAQGDRREGFEDSSERAEEQKSEVQKCRRTKVKRAKVKKSKEQKLEV
jgi:hypothetical protein